jgi:NAD(P) transhydrogenase subunit beta
MHISLAPLCRRVVGWLSEAEVPYAQVMEMEEVGSDFFGADVVLVIGANDVVNPTATTDTASPIYGISILEMHKA